MKEILAYFKEKGIWSITIDVDKADRHFKYEMSSEY